MVLGTQTVHNTKKIPPHPNPPPGVPGGGDKRPVSKPVWSQIVLVVAVMLATASAALLAYGTDAYWGQFHRGLSLIVFTHRLQWVLATFSLVLCLVVVALIVGGRRRVWWLIALGPIMALFVHRFISSPMREYAIVENPLCVTADLAPALRDTDDVGGVQWGDQPYAYPYAALFTSPVVIQSNHENRFMLIWSAFANRALAFKIKSDIKLGELQIVSMPANSILLYNGRIGQFINGVTGETTAHEKPAGFASSVRTHKITWRQWKKLHPNTQVFLPPGGRIERAAPLQPKYAMAREKGSSPTTHPVESQIIFVPTTRPIAIPVEAVSGDPANISDGPVHLLLFRDRDTGQLKAFDRHVKDDLVPMFRSKSDPKRPAVVWEDQDSGTEWSAEGKGIEGLFKGEQLRPMAVEDSLYWAVMSHWYPDLQWAIPRLVSNKAGNFKNPGETKRRGGKAK